jgi:hypothetical protein
VYKQVSTEDNDDIENNKLISDIAKLIEKVEILNSFLQVKQK